MTDARIVGNRPALIDQDHMAPLTVAVHAEAAAEAAGKGIGRKVGAAVLAALEARKWGYAIEQVTSATPRDDTQEILLETVVTGVA